MGGKRSHDIDPIIKCLLCAKKKSIHAPCRKCLSMFSQDLAFRRYPRSPQRIDSGSELATRQLLLEGLCEYDMTD
jgi:hypothetical protein